jgi:signal transduction histidine kinase
MSAFRKSIARWWQDRDLVGKHSVLLLAAALLTLPFAFVVMGSLLQPAFDKIEMQSVADQKGRVSHALREFEKTLQNATSDYAVWDDMYAYAGSGDHSFEAETLTPAAYVNNGIDYRGVVRMDGTFVWSSAVDRASVRHLSAESDAIKALIADPAFFSRARKVPKTITYVRAKRGIYLLATNKIVKSDESGDPAGILICGILLNEKSLSEALQVAVTIDQNPDAALKSAIAANPSGVVSRTGPQAISTWIGLVGLDKKFLGAMEFSTTRSISTVGASAIQTASIAIIIASLGLILMLAYGIRLITVRRLQALESYVQHFKLAKQDLDPRLSTGKDEIASLSRQFVALSQQLDDAELELRQKSYLQGKADSAAGMLHNVRNALAPVRVMQEKWLREESLPFRANMKKAAAELASDTLDPARKAELERFMVSAARTITLTADGRRDEMDQTKSSIDQVSEILSAYDFDTSAVRSGDVIDLCQVVQQHFKILASRGGENVTLILPDTVPDVEGNRVQLGQVLDNIFVNAHEAMTAAGVDNMQVSVTLDPSPKGSVTLRITDNGDGIDADDIAKTFHRGYSTRNHKAGGLGMHWSANAMRAMGGGITLESDGKGKGASAVLTFKAAAPEISAPQLSAAAV